MRIFNTYPQLNAALELPAMEPGAYRFCAQYGIAGFQCAHCGAVKLFSVSCGTGYGVQHGQFVCYDCCAELDRAHMAKHAGPFYCYVDVDKKRVTSWPGGVLGNVRSYHETNSGWNRGTIARFHVQDTHGNWWQGRGAGAGMACTLRPMKTPAYAKHLEGLSHGH